MKESIFSKEEFTEEDLKNIISQEIEESINLDYKSAKSLAKNDGKKREIAKDVSAFANSDGGIIIYGMVEENHKPLKVDFVDGEDITKEWLENVIDSNIQQKIQDVRIYPIRFDSNLKKTVYIVKIPASLNAPHISADKKYYRRYNFKSVPMEEYEIRLLYNRKSTSEIDFFAFMGTNVEKNQIDYGQYEYICDYEVQVENISESIEMNCKIEAVFLNIEGLDIKFSYSKDDPISHRTSIENNVSLVGYNDSPIFSEEKYPILKFTLTINEFVYESFKENAEIKLKLYDSCSIKENSYKFSELKPIEQVIDK
ncbi:AlbA family DNA-binding domain-containing protein [Sunxiuqinia elliptica]